MTEILDSQLVDKVKQENDPMALDELIQRHSGIYVDMIMKYGGSSLTDTQFDDLMLEKNYNIYNAALNYDPTKSKFSTFLALRTRYLCLTNKTNNKKSANIVDFDSLGYCLPSESDSPDCAMEKSELLEKINKALDSFTDKRIKEIFMERYFSTTNGKLKAWKEVAEKMNLSIQGCIGIHDKNLSKILKKIEENETSL